MILVDTDIMVDFLRGYPPAKAWFASVSEEPIALPGFVKLELLDFASDKEAINRTLKALAPFAVCWPSTADCNRALGTFAGAKLSHGTGSFDALIGETANGLGLPLHTFNIKHYAPIPGLRTIQPYARGTI